MEKQKSVLVIDDDEDTRAMYAEILRKAGFSVRTAADGLEGLALVRRQLPDVVFSGIMMPRMDGFALLTALAADTATKDVPVVINSHLGRDTDREQATRLGARDFIIRDMTPPNEVIDRIGAAIGGHLTYDLDVDPYTRHAARLARAFGMEDGVLRCPDGGRLVAKVTITDTTTRTGTVDFVCE